MPDIKNAGDSRTISATPASLPRRYHRDGDRHAHECAIGLSMPPARGCAAQVAPIQLGGFQAETIARSRTSWLP